MRHQYKWQSIKSVSNTTTDLSPRISRLGAKTNLAYISPTHKQSGGYAHAVNPCDTDTSFNPCDTATSFSYLHYDTFPIMV